MAGSTAEECKSIDPDIMGSPSTSAAPKSGSDQSTKLGACKHTADSDSLQQRKGCNEDAHPISEGVLQNRDQAQIELETTRIASNTAESSLRHDPRVGSMDGQESSAENIDKPAFSIQMKKQTSPRLVVDLPLMERIRIGGRCKQLIDYCRLQHLLEMGFQVIESSANNLPI